MSSPTYIPVLGTHGPVTIAGVGVPAGEMGPQDHGYTAWTGDPYHIQGGSPLVAGTVYLQRLQIRRATTPTALTFSVSTVAATVTAGQCWAGLYDSDGARLAAVAIDADITSSGVTPVSVAPGELAAESYVWAAIVVSAGTMPHLHRFTTSSTPPNAGLAAAGLRSAVAATAQTSLPASITPGTLTGTGGITMWMGLS